MNTSLPKVIILHLRIEHEKKTKGFPDSRQSDRKMLLKKQCNFLPQFLDPAVSVQKKYMSAAKIDFHKYEWMTLHYSSLSLESNSWLPHSTVIENISPFTSENSPFTMEDLSAANYYTINGASIMKSKNFNNCTLYCLLAIFQDNIQLMKGHSEVTGLRVLLNF